MWQHLRILAITNIDASPLPQTVAGSTSVQTVITTALTIIGAVTLLIIVIGGVKYITSQGDPQGVSTAKRTILYALVGLLVCIFAQAIVSFVLGRI